MKKFIIIFLCIILNKISLAVEQEVNKFRLIGYGDNHEKKWELEGGYAQLEANLVNIKPVHAKIYEQNSVIDINAKRGILNKENNLIFLRDDVVINKENSLFLYTDLLNWDGKKSRVWTDSSLKIVRNEAVITGKGGQASTAFKTVEIEKDVKLTTPNKTTVTCDGPLEVDYNRNIAIFHKNVHIVDQRGQLFSDKLEVYFDPQEKKIIKAHAIGNVRIKRKDSITFSQEAIYDVEKGKVTLIGNPKLIIYPEK